MGLLEIDNLNVWTEKSLTVRNSTVDSLLLCGKRVGYARTEGFDHVPSEAMFFGTVVHDRIEAYIEGGTTLELFTGPAIQRAADELASAEGFDYFDIDPDRRVQFEREVSDAVWRWEDEVYPEHLDDMVKYGVIAEQTRLRQLGTLPDGESAWFQGTADMIVPSQYGVDWKTAGRGWHESRAHATNQAAAYTWLYPESEGRFCYWVYDRTAGEWTPYWTERTQAQVDAYLEVAWGAALQIWSGAYTAKPWDSTFGKYKRGWWCSPKYCGAWNVCEAKHIADDLDESVPIDITKGW